jgi:hypothetical protein
MDVLRRSVRKSRMERIKNENIKEIMGVKGTQDIIDIIQKKRLQWYGHVKRMPEERNYTMDTTGEKVEEVQEKLG